MPTYSKSTSAQLRRRLQELQIELEAAAPALIAEIKLVESLLAAQSVRASEVYAKAVTPKEAIDLCLDLCGDWTLTKKQVIESILEGGYMAAKPKSARGLINDSLNHHIGKGYLALVEDKVGRASSAAKKDIHR